MAPVSAYRFCTPDQQSIALKAKIVIFLENDGSLLDKLKQLTLQLDVQFSGFWGDTDGWKLSRVMSVVFGAAPNPDLQSKFIEHLHKHLVTVPTHECFDALGPVVVGLTL